MMRGGTKMEQQLSRMLESFRGQLPLLAQIYKELMDEFVKAGFSREEALELLKLHKVGN